MLECLYVCYVSEFTLNIYSELPRFVTLPFMRESTSAIFSTMSLDVLFCWLAIFLANSKLSTLNLLRSPWPTAQIQSRYICLNQVWVNRISSPIPEVRSLSLRIVLIDWNFGDKLRICDCLALANVSLSFYGRHSCLHLFCQPPDSSAS